MIDFERAVCGETIYSERHLMSGILTTRFAPSPSGELHLGHLLAAGVARRLADEYGGRCLLRMEDIDLSRCRPEYADGILADLAWLGIHFDGDVVFQSLRFPFYRQVLDRLKDMGVLYPCFCTRRQIAAELESSMQAPQGDILDPYPGICRHLGEEERREKMNSGVSFSWRSDCKRAGEMTGVLEWEDMRKGIQRFHPASVGDVILSRKDCSASYHLCVVADDAERGVTHVTRGEDLFSSTCVHRLLQELLDLPVPTWLHHGLVCDDSGVRLAKRNQSLSLAEMRREGVSPSDVWRSLPLSLNSSFISK